MTKLNKPNFKNNYFNVACVKNYINFKFNLKII